MTRKNAPLKLSKAVTNGMFVKKRGDKYIVCPWNQMPDGVFYAGHNITVLTNVGLQIIHVPLGIQIDGPVTVKVKR